MQTKGSSRIGNVTFLRQTGRGVERQEKEDKKKYLAPLRAFVTDCHPLAHNNPRASSRELSAAYSRRAGDVVARSEPQTL